MEPLRPAGSVSAVAPGKINLCFRIGEPRPDGTRGVATLYQAVSIYDTVTVSASDEFKVTQLGFTGFGKVSPPDKNLALKAAKLMAQKAGIDSPVRIDVDKQIPKGAGMSGGSADAAAALVACNKFWGLGLKLDDLKDLALEIGADVPFSLEGGSAVGTGHGDEFSQALSTGTFHWTIVPIGPRLEEEVVLEELDKYRAKHGNTLGGNISEPLVDVHVVRAVRSGDPFYLALTMHHDAELVSAKLSPELKKLNKLIADQMAILGRALLAMGPATAFLLRDRENAEDLRDWLLEEGYQSIAVHGPVGGARLI